MIKDLRQRGMLDDTLILCTSEFGRTPFTQSDADKVGAGRDHNNVWIFYLDGRCWFEARTGLWSTDENGWKAVEKPVMV